MNEKLTAYALNELPPDERAELEAQMQHDPALAAQAAELAEFCQVLGSNIAPKVDTLTKEQRLTLIKTFKATPARNIVTHPWRKLMILGTSALAACLAVMFLRNQDVRPASGSILVADAGSAAQRKERSERVNVLAPKADPSARAAAPSADAPALKNDVPAQPLLAAAAPAPDLAGMKQLSDNNSNGLNTLQPASPKIVTAPPSPIMPPSAAPTAPAVIAAAPRPLEPAMIARSFGKGAPELTMGTAILSQEPFKSPLSDEASLLPARAVPLVSSAAAPPLAAIGTPMTEQLDRDGYLTIVGGTGDIILSPSGSKPVVALNLGNLEERSSGIPATLPWAVTDGIIGGWATTSDALDMNGQFVTGARADSSSAMSFGDLTLRPPAQTLPLNELSRTAGSNITLNGGALSYDAPSTPPSLNTVQTTAGVISGSAGVTKVGGGILTLTGSNTFSGGTNVNAGVVSIESQASSALTITGGTTNVNGTPITKAGTGTGFGTGTGMRTLTLSGSSTADNAKQANSGVALTSANTLNVSGSGGVTFGGTIATGSTSTTTGGISVTQSSGGAMNPPPAAVAGKPVAAAPQEPAKAKSASPVTPQSVDGLIVTNAAATRTRMLNAVSDKWEEKAAPGLVIKDVAGVEGESRLSATTPAPAATATQTYRPIIENPFTYVTQEPLSTFSTDVDTASYANVRRFLNHGQRPPADAVRLEELINYFPYSYEPPADNKPFAVHVDVAEAPWQPLHRLARIALKAREIHEERRAANFVFLLDVSGSMSPPERLPLIKQGLRMLVEQLREDDHVAIVTYAGHSGVALESTSAAEKDRIMQVIEQLKAGGSTNGAGGIALAYEQAARSFHKDRVNRVILATDGDFNVGTSSVNALEALIAEKAKTGIFLSVLGVGTNNLKDHTMQTLADRGNGNYHYLDSLSEARKVLVDQMTGTLVTVAKDVKVQVEFNPAQVAAYRLIGYEKRMLAKQDFNDDKKDAGEIGAGHTVTALYEIVPASLKYPDGKPLVDDLKYQGTKATGNEASSLKETPSSPQPPASTLELMTVKLRYKAPDGDKSQLIEQAVTDAGKKLSEGSKDFQFAVSVAGFGMLLRDSQSRGELNWQLVRTLAQKGKGEDPNGYRGEFLQLIDKARGVCEPR